MPLVYADTSVIFASLHPRDEFSDVVDSGIKAMSPDFVYWSFIRYELRHNLRRCRTDSHGETAWTALRAAEKTQSRFRWQPDLWIDSLLESAEEISSRCSVQCGAGSVDIVHVAAAKRLNVILGIDEFWTCDIEQAKAAELEGMKVRLFVLRKTEN
jgi:predicted nucleic acid-binding protein